MINKPLFKEFQLPGKTNFNNESKISDFLSMLFAFRNKLHFLHLETNSYAEHKALDEAYTNILDLIDELAESVQGIYGLQKYKSLSCEETGNASDIVMYMYKYVDEYRSLFKESWIQNILDEIQQLFAQTNYKLKFLK